MCLIVSSLPSWSVVLSDGKDVPGLEFERERKEYTINQLKWD